MENQITEILVSGSGADKKQAFNQALQTIQTKLMKQSNDIFLQIEPIDVVVVKAEQKETTERFLFLFLPRQKMTYFVELKVKVQVKKITTAQVTFIEQKEAAFQKENIWQFFSRKLSILFQSR